LRTLKRSIAICTLCWAFEGSAAAQGMLVASIGKALGGDAQTSSGTYAIGAGGGGAHSIGSELEFSQTSHFTDLSGQDSKVLSLMASIYVAVPVHAVRPYAIFGYGFIRQRTKSSVGSVLSNLSNNDVGYSAGGGVTYYFSRHAGVRGDFRHFKVRKSNGLSFQRILIGIVLGA
jgi:Outer membrane protein beta-barrel domain